MDGGLSLFSLLACACARSCKVVRKLAQNAAKYPADLAFGKADKYTAYTDAKARWTTGDAEATTTVAAADDAEAAPPPRYLLARHGETTFNAEGRIHGTLDSSVLTDEGITQAAGLGAWQSSRVTTRSKSLVVPSQSEILVSWRFALRFMVVYARRAVSTHRCAGLAIDEAASAALHVSYLSRLLKPRGRCHARDRVLARPSSQARTSCARGSRVAASAPCGSHRCAARARRSRRCPARSPGVGARCCRRRCACATTSARRDRGEAGHGENQAPSAAVPRANWGLSRTRAPIKDALTRAPIKDARLHVARSGSSGRAAPPASRP